MTIKTSIVIPTYKEKENLKIIIPLIFKNLSRKVFIFEIIIVDDDSKDGTVEILNKFKKRYRNLRLFVRKNKIRDLSLSCIQGFKLSKFENILVMDADLQHNPSYINLLIKNFEKK